MTDWLTEEQQGYWRAWLAASLLLSDQLSRDLQAAHGLTMADYEVLVRLSESPDRRMRMSDLASVTLNSRSRISHQVDRMEASGLIERQVCDEDRRGSFAALTDKGWKTLVTAAPDHVASVRANLVDILTDEQFAALGHACAIIAAHLEARQ